MKQVLPAKWITLALGLALLASPAMADAALPSPAEASRALSESVAAHSGDLSLLLAGPETGATALLRGRPDSTGLVQLALREPALRIHYAQGPLAGLGDANLDGIPDRISAAREAALATLRLCERLGLGAPADDGDGELDIYLIPLGGLTRGYALVEGSLPPGRGGYGFVVADPSPHLDEHSFRAIVARSVARLVLASRDASAPSWWTEASALWIEERANGTSADIAHALHARWSRPEIGLAAGMPALIRGNAGLLWALDAPAREAAVLRATWRALSARTDSADADRVVLEALETSAALPLHELQMRAGIRQVVHGQPPTRWALEIGGRGLREDVPVWVGPRGAALIHLARSSESEVLRLALAGDEGAWAATLIAHAGSGQWERVPLRFEGNEAELHLPWQDYDEAVLLLAAPAERLEGGALRVSARTAARGALFGLASFAARATPMRGFALQWESSWEEGLFGWMVERSDGSEGPWEALSEIPLPSLGNERGGSAYTLYDPRPAGSGALRYRLVGVTRDGLRVSGPTLVAIP